MKQFILKSDVVFEAEDIDDALSRLSAYFADLAEKDLGEVDSIFILGEIHVHAVP